jgi:c-di-GMP-binding flagellar brake protein YcgR
MPGATMSNGDVTLADAAIDQSITSRAGITLLLERLRQQHCLLAVRAQSDDATYTSMILEVEQQRRYFVLDALAPATGNSIVAKDRHLHLAARSEGADMAFSGKVTAIGENNGVVYYRVPYPDAIEYRQKRRHHRAVIPPAHSVPILLQTEAKDLIRGELRDISIGGCNIRIIGGAAELADGDIMSRCIITLPAATRVTATVELCHVSPVGSRRPNRVGARFYNLSPADERRIEQFIAYLDREFAAKQLRR